MLKDQTLKKTRTFSCSEIWRLEPFIIRGLDGVSLRLSELTTLDDHSGHATAK